MPDTYTSQFSGEEIDAALRAAQIISGADTPAELRKKLEIRGDTIPVSAEDSTLISEALKKIPTTSGGGINPNLLDNWFFGRPVNQKEGKIIPAGKSYYTTPDITLPEVGKTDKAYTVIEIQNYTGYGQRATISIDGTVYYVWDQDAVQGYTGGGHTIDRWRIGYDGTFTVNVSDTGVSLVSGNDGSWKNFYETIETSKLIVGRTYTFSFLAEDNGGVRQVYIPDYGSVFDGDKGLYTITFVAKETTQNQDFGIQTNVGKTSIPLAAKLELGGAQTLAHQEDGVWILNEIPDFGEQLARCLRHDYIIGSNDMACPLCTGYAYAATSCLAVIDLPVCMRANPVLSITGSVILRFANNSVFRTASVANYGFSGDKIQLFFEGLSNLPVGSPCDIYVDVGSKFEINSNL